MPTAAVLCATDNVYVRQESSAAASQALVSQLRDSAAQLSSDLAAARDEASRLRDRADADRAALHSSLAESAAKLSAVEHQARQYGDELKIAFAKHEADEREARHLRQELAALKPEYLAAEDKLKKVCVWWTVRTRTHVRRSAVHARAACLSAAAR